MLNDGKLEAFLKKTSAQMGVGAVHNKILSRSSDLKGLAEIKNHIRDNRNAVRTEWRKITTDRIQNFFGEQFVSLLGDLTSHNKKTQAYSLKSMLTAFLNHIVNTDKIQRNAVLQRDLAGFIKDLTFKTNSLRSLWARLDGQDDPETLGAEAARHVERRRQRELTLRMAKATFTLGTPNQVRLLFLCLPFIHLYSFLSTHADHACHCSSTGAPGARNGVPEVHLHQVSLCGYGR